MNYYIVTKEVFNTMEKANISFRLFNLAKTNVLVSTTDTVGSSLQQFADSAAASTYTNKRWLWCTTMGNRYYRVYSRNR